MVHDEDLFELAQASYSQRKGRIGSNFPLSASGSKVVSVGAGEGQETSSQFQDSIESPLLSPLSPHTPAPISSSSSMPNTSTTSRKEDLGAAVVVVNTSRSTARSTGRRPSFMHTKTSATPVAGGQGSKTTGGGGSKASQLSVTSNSKEVEVQVLTKLDIHDSPNLTLTGLENLSTGR
jgi:hypothetical protein